MLKKLTIFFLSAFLTLSGLEIGLRIHKKYFQKRDATSIEQYICSYDSLLGWRGESLMQGRALFSEGSFDISHNSRGFRDREYSFQKPSNITRILVLGDSFTWGYCMDISEVFTKVLERMLEEDYEILSFGIPGYSTDQELLLLNSEGINYNPDIVILAFFLDDIFNNANIATHDGKYPKPYFVLDKNNKVSLKNCPVPILKHPLACVEFIKKRFYKLKTRLHMPAQYRQCDWKTYVLSPDYANSQNWRITLQLLHKMNEICISHNIKFIIAVIPTREQIKLKNNVPQTILANFCNRFNIPMIDFLPLLAENNYYRDDIHWDRNGHLIAAKAIYDFLIKNGFVKKQ